jgi:hypothetical protein
MVLSETNGGATTSFGYEVSVGTKGEDARPSSQSVWSGKERAGLWGKSELADDHVLRAQSLQAKAVQNVSKTAVNIGGQP